VDWFVHCSRFGSASVDRMNAPEAAIEAACQMLDDGIEVLGIGEGDDLSNAIGKAQIARVCALRMGPKSGR
jgi:hypothetical protein